MQIQARVRVTGGRFWKAPNQDTGEMIDSGKLYFETSVKNSSKESYGANDAGWSFGVMGMEYKCANSDVVRKIKALNLPASFFAIVTLEQETDGDKIFQVVLDVKPEASPDLKPGQISKAA